MDMSELRDEQSVARLVGPSADEAGTDREGRLTIALRQKPQALLLLDEIEKAHPRVLDVFLKCSTRARSPTRGAARPTRASSWS